MIMDDVKLSQKDCFPPCTSLQRIVNEREYESCYEFGQKKKDKNDGKKREKRVAHTEHEPIIAKQETEEKKHDKTCGNENPCGDIVDVRA